MACSPTATATLYTSVASTSTSSSFSPSVTTIPPVVTTITTQTCAGTDVNKTDCATTTETSTLDAGETTTIQVPVQIIYDITQAVPTATLFAPCPDPAPPAAPPPAPAPEPPAPANSTTTTTTSSSLSSTSPTAFDTTVVTPAPSVIVSSQSITQADGSVIVLVTTMTSTFPPMSVVVPQSSGAVDGNAKHSSESTVIAPVVGGILGGFFGLIGLVVLIWWLWRRRSYLPRPLSPDQDQPEMAYTPRRGSARPDSSVERAPYHYGGLGSANGHGSRPNTPRARDSVYSQTAPPATPPLSARDRSSTHLSFTHSGAPTPTFFATTAISPGHSVPSSRPSTPGHIYTQNGGSAPPSAFAGRQSWPRYAGDDEPDSAGVTAYGPGMVRERRPSRLSLTLSMMEGTTESGERAERRASTGRRSATASLHGVGGSSGAEVARSGSMSTDVHVLQPSQSTLFVVNCEDPKEDAPPKSAPP